MPFSPLSMIMKAQQSALLRWLLGLRNFSLMPIRPGEDPIRRIRLRLVTTLSGLVALLFTVLLGLVAAATALLAASPRPVGWELAVGGTGLFVWTALAWLRSRANRMPDPGVVVVSALLNAAAIAGGVMILMRNAN